MLRGKYNLLGASACVKLKRYEDAITWCDKGLAVSFLTRPLIKSLKDNSTKMFEVFFCQQIYVHDRFVPTNI